MDRMISYCITLALAAALMFAWDRHPHWQFDMPDPLPGSISFPDSLATRLANASGDLAAWKTSSAACSTALAMQQKAVETLKAAGDAKLGLAASLPQAARSSQAMAQSNSRTILAVTPSDDRCAFAQAVDAAFLEGLK